MKNSDIEILGKAAYALGKYLPESEFGLFKDYLRVYEALKEKKDKEKRNYQENAEYYRRATRQWRKDNPEKQKEHWRQYDERKSLKEEQKSTRGSSVINYSPEALEALTEYVKAFEKCANEPQDTYGVAFIMMDAKKGRLKKFLTKQEFDAVIANIDEIREDLLEAGLIP